MTAPLILIVEDEAAQAEMLSYNLQREGFETLVVGTGEDALAAVDYRLPDLVIVDWMLPERSGIEICRHLRARPATKRLPIIMLTARGEEGDRVLGLEAGCDDYVAKPYSPREVAARVRALLRRSGLEDAGNGLQYGNVSIDLEAHKVTRDGAAVHLGPTEFRLLTVMMERPGRVFTRQTLLDRVWGARLHVESRTIDVHIRRLRKSLNAGGAPDIIRTVRGAGYAVDAQDEAS